MFLVVLLGMALHPSPVATQGSSHWPGLKFSATISALRLDYPFPPPRGAGGEWVPAGTIEARALPREWFHLAISYTRTGSVEGVACPTESGCGIHPFWSQSGVLLAGVGVERAFEDWVPFSGIARGQFSNKRLDHSTWVWYVGVEKGLGERIGLLLEYRTIRVRWDSGDLGWNQDVGFGLVLRGR